MVPKCKGLPGLAHLWPFEPRHRLPNRDDKWDAGEGGSTRGEWSADADIATGLPFSIPPPVAADRGLLWICGAEVVSRWPDASHTEVLVIHLGCVIRHHEFSS